METEKQELPIVISSPTLAGVYFLAAMAAPMEALVGLGKMLGYDGLEWKPQRWGVAEAQIAHKRLSPFAKAGIISAEQSYRGEDTLKKAWNHPHRTVALMSYLALPHRTESVKNLVRLQATIGNILVTVYPPETPKETVLQRGLNNRLVQLYPEIADTYQAKSLPELAAKIQDRDLGINLDFFHFSRLCAYLRTTPTSTDIAALFPLIRVVQYPFGRGDIPEHQYKSSDNAHLLADLINRGYRGPVVNETYPGLNPFSHFPKLRGQASHLKQLIQSFI